MGPPELFSPENFDLFFNAELDKHNVNTHVKPLLSSKSLSSSSSSSSTGPQNKKPRVTSASGSFGAGAGSSWSVFDASLFRGIVGGEVDVSSSASSAAAGVFGSSYPLLLSHVVTVLNSNLTQTNLNLNTYCCYYCWL